LVEIRHLNLGQELGIRSSIVEEEQAITFGHWSVNLFIG